MQNLKVKAIAAAMAAITAAAPVLSTYTEVFAETVNDYSGSESVDDGTAKVETEVDSSVQENLGDTVETKDENAFLFINIQSSGGTVTVNKGEENEQNIKIVNQKDDNSDEMVSNINSYDKDGILISSENAEANNYVYTYEAKKDDVLTLNILADEGYQIEKYDTVSKVNKKDGFVIKEAESEDFMSGKNEYYSLVFLDTNKNIEIGFSKKDEQDTNEDITITEESSIPDTTEKDKQDTNEDITITEESEASDTSKSETEDLSKDSIDDDITVNDSLSEEIITQAPDCNSTESNGLSEPAKEDINIEDTESTLSDEDIISNEDDEPAKEDVNIEDTESTSLNEDVVNNGDDEDTLEETVDDSNDEQTSEHFLEPEDEDDLDTLDADNFSSARLLVLTDDKENIIDEEHLIGCHDNIYLLQYNSAKQAMIAYLYYEKHVDAVEPDMEIKAASEESSDTDYELSSTNSTLENNAIVALNEEDPIDTTQTVDSDKVIALIDTGVSEHENVIGHVSLIDDNLTGNLHGDTMVKDIVEQNENAKILSIKALDDTGYGTYSAIVSAIEYAIDTKVDIINMSMYTKKSMTTSVVKTEIEKAVDAGIIVVGSAGNDGANVRNYIPGCAESAYIIGACDNDGNIIETSNYGMTVDYNVVADSTSEAAAKFSGYISKNGFDTLPDNTLIFNNNYINSGDAEKEYDYNGQCVNKVDADLLFMYAAKAYGNDFINQAKETDFADIYNVSDTEMKSLENKMKKFFDEDSYKLNKYIEQTQLLDKNGVNLTGEYSTEEERKENLKRKDKVLTNVPIEIKTAHIWDAYKSKCVENVAKIFKKDDKFIANITDGDMKSLISGDICLIQSEKAKQNEIEALNITAEPSTFNYSWQVNKNGTIKINVFPSGVQEQDEDSYFTGLLIPESVNFKAARYNDFYSIGWNSWSGSKTYCQMLGINASKYSDWLYTHSQYYHTTHGDEALYSYYIGTPYGSGWLVGGAYPHGDSYNDGTDIYEGMNCTAFVWHVLWKAMQASGNTNTPAAYGLGISRDNTFKGWTTVPLDNDVKHAYFQTKKDLIEKGKPKRGDIIWIMGEGEYTVGTDDIDNHILFYWGNGTNDVAWHSTHKTTKNTATSHASWCDGSFHEDKKGHIVKTNGNCQTEIASKQPTLAGYILYRAGGSYPQNVQIVKKAETGWNDNLIGTKFSLYRKKDDGTWGKKETVTITDKNPKAFNYPCQPGKTFKIKETHTNPGYKPAPDIIFTISANNSAMVKTFTVVNVTGPTPTPPTESVTPTPEEPDEPDPSPTPAPCQIYVSKHSTISDDIIDSNDQYSKAGAVFGIYSDAGCSQEIGRVTTGNTGVSNPLQLPCASDGNYTYYVKEITAPAGHDLNTEIKPLNVSLPTDNGKWFNVDFWDAATVSHIRIKKVAADGVSWNDNLKGTEFSLYDGDTWLETISIQNSDFHIFQYGCLLGKTYTVKETKVMPGKIKSPDFNVTINGGANYQPNYWYSVANKDVPKVKVTKNVSEGNDNELLQLSYYSRANATFEVYADAALQNRVGTLSTDANGETGEITLPCQTDGTYTYYVKETKAPDGHKITDTVKPITVTLPQDAGATKVVEFTDEPDVDEVPNALVQKRSSKGEPVKGVVFEVKLYDGKYNTANECPANMLKKTWYLKSTGEQGLVEFKDENIADDINNSYRSDNFYTWNNKIVIPKGCTLTMQEKKTPSKYVLDDSIILWKTGETEPIKVKKLYNQIAPCKIKIRKLSDDGKPLQGVEFELKFVKESEPYTSDADKSYIPLLKQGETTKATTDADGYIVWQNLDQGEYQITETKTISGNTLLKDPIKITLPITMTDKQAKAMSAATDQGQFDEYTNKWYFYEATFEVTNTPNFVMPTTGANGVWRFIFFGFGTMAVLTTGLIVYDAKSKRTRKRRRKE